MPEAGLRECRLGSLSLGAGGVEEIVELDLNDKEQADMKASGDHVREVIEAYENLTTDDA